MKQFENIPISNDSRRVDLDGPVVVAHQAEFLPWLGYISKATMGDIYLILDDTQFKKKYFENRNKIRFPNREGWLWLNVPIKDKDRLPNMMDVEITNNDFKAKHLETIKTSYGKSPYFKSVYEELEDLYLCRSDEMLCNFNIRIIKFAFKKFNIKIPVYSVSEINRNGKIISGSGTDLVISIAKAVKAKTLVAGHSGKEYLNIDKFRSENINLVFQEFKHPVYSQIHGNFMPYMSFIDLLFNYGDNAIDVLPKSSFTF